MIGSSISDKKKQKIQDKFDEIEHTYSSWNNSLSKKTSNLDSYVLSSQTTVKGFKKFIQGVLAENDGPTNSTDSSNPPKPVRRKSVRVIDCVPTAKKKIKTQEDIDSVVAYIKTELEKALSSNDELNHD